METLELAELCFPLNTSCRPMPLTSKAALINTMVSTIALLTVTLNLLVIISISHFRQLHTPTNILLLSLAVSDLLVGLLVMPVAISTLHSCWYLGNLICALFQFVCFILTSASVGNMVLISVDRYAAICYPLRYSSMITNSRVKICARVMRSQIAAAKPSTVTGFVKKSEIRAARTLGIVLLVFLLCLLPYYCPFVTAQDTSAAASSVATWLFYFNSCVNPLIYALFYPWFRKAIKLIINLQILQPGSCEARLM
ncbi:trace amine-associated receptor 13c-like [Centroberyx affinis]|uniref:trace amine-associated receptor 13c-like n=1 Tax=Centroberyx affinis TaxID=166261 RepID=UPI003A5C49E8